MSTLSFILMLAAMLAVLGVLVVGLFSMAKGGEFNKKYGNRMMQARVFLQAAAIVAFVFAVIAAKK